MAEGLRSPIITLRTINFGRGMVDRNKPWTIPEDAAAHLENLVVDRPGFVTRRLGVQSLGAVSGATNVNLPQGLFPFYDRAQLVADMLLSVNGGKLWMLPGNAQVFQKACGASLTDSLHMASRGVWAGAVDTVYISNAQLDDSNVSRASQLLAYNVDQQHSQTASMAPLCTVWWQNRLWVGGNRLTRDNETLWWSELNDGLLYSTTNTLPIERGRGGRITALVPVRGGTPRLIVFKQSAIVIADVFWGSSSNLIPAAGDAIDFNSTSLRLITDNVGAVATLSVQFVPGAPAGDIFFLAADGIRTISRAQDDTVSGSSLPLSAPIQLTIDRINFAWAHKAVSAVFDQKYHLAVPLDGATENTHVISYDITSGAWFLNTWDPKAFVVARLNTSADRLIYQNNFLSTDSTVSGLSAGWHAYRAYAGGLDPSGSAVPYELQTRGYVFDRLELRKKLSWFGLQVSNLNATHIPDIHYRIDNGSWFPLGSMTFPVGSSGSTVVLGQTPLPWTPAEAAVNFRKLGMEDTAPAYIVQFRVFTTNPSDFGMPSILQAFVGGRLIDQEFDNSIS